MFGKVYLICIFAITICLVISTKAILARPLYQLRLGFEFNDNAGVPIKYHITNVKLKYDYDDLEVSRPNENFSVKINIKKATIEFLNGLTKNDYKQYDLPNGSKFQMVVEGTGTLSEDGTNVLRCKFTYAEKNDAPIAGIAEPVKQGTLSRLSKFDNDLCRTIKVSV